MDALVCHGTVAPTCGGDVLLVIIHTRATPTPMCASCRATAERLGLPVRPYAIRDMASERRRNRFVLAGESLGRRVTDALVYAWRDTPMT